MTSSPLVLAIPAYNESRCLVSLLATLKASTAWRAATARVVLVALNGCTDDSRAVLERMVLKDARLEVLELPEPNKNAAWNRLVEHGCELGPSMVFVDAEVRPHPLAVTRLLARLEEEPSLALVSALPCPTIGLLERPGWYQRARVRFAERAWVRLGSRETVYPRANLYAIRSARAAAIRLPEKGLIGDDLFLGQLLGDTAVIEPSSLVYFTPPDMADHLRQRRRQRAGLSTLKRDFPELRPRLPSPPLPRHFESLSELVYFGLVSLVEQRARRPSAETHWAQIASGRAWGRRSSDGLRFRLLSRVQSTMLRVGRLPAGRHLLTLAYRLTAWLTAGLLAALPGVRAFRISGSIDNSRITPGLSDIDGEIILEESRPERELEVVTRIVGLYSGLRYLLPVLQEPFLQRASDEQCAALCGEPWTVSARYRVLSGEDGRKGENPRPTAEAFASLFLRRFLRFYTRQAIFGAGYDSRGHVRMHQRGLASVNAVLRNFRSGRHAATVEPWSLEREMDRPASPSMERLFGWYRRLAALDFKAAAYPDREELGARLAATACLVVRDLAGALTSSPPKMPENESPSAFEGDTALDRFLGLTLQPLLDTLKRSSRLSGLPCLQSRAGPQNWQHRLYLLLPPSLEEDSIAACYHELRAAWKLQQRDFPESYYGVFPYPALLPREALSLLDLSYGAAWEKAVLAERYPLLRPLLGAQERSPALMILRNLAEQAVPILRRVDMETASPRTRLRFLDVFCGLLPAAAVMARTGQAPLSQPEACRAYQRTFDDAYAEFLGSLPIDWLWFEGPLLAPGWLARQQRRWYPVLRRALDQHWQERVQVLCQT